MMKNMIPGDINIASSQYSKERGYWLSQLSGELVKSSFQYDHIKKDVHPHSPGSCHFKLTGEVFSQLMKLSSNSDYTLHIILTAGVVVLLHKCTFNNDIILGTTIDKQDFEAEFINSLLALRTQINGNMTFKNLLLRVRETIINANENQNYPIETLLYDLNMTVSPHDFPLFDVVVLLENIQDKRYIEHIHTSITFAFNRKDESIKSNLTYLSSRYEKTTIERIIEHFKNLMRRVLFNLDLKISDIDILGQQEKKQLLIDFNSTTRKYPGDKTLNELFEEQVEKNPGYLAVIYNEKRLMYQKLNEKANQLARQLKMKGVKANHIVGIMLERSIEMIVGMLGILKAGGAYLPLDPEYPGERLRFMMDDSGISLVLTQSHLESVVSFAGEFLHLDSKGIYTTYGSNPKRCNNSNDRAYVIYTSGSTGKSKGVVVHHRSIVNTISWRKECYQFDHRDTVLQIPSFSFDSSVEDIFTPLISGSRLVLIPGQHRLNFNYLEEAIKRNRVTHLLMVPNYYSRLLEEMGDSLKQMRTITIAGESFTKELVQRHFDTLGNVRLFNEYGPTETSVCAAVYEFQQDKIKVLIGKPIYNAKCYILNSGGQLNPVGIPGELVISGVGVAEGYLNNPELTAEKFISAPGSWLTTDGKVKEGTMEPPEFYPRPYALGFRLYKTGDLAKWHPDGNIEFLGRKDQQVKIRGFRVELGEIENCLRDFAGVQESVVVVSENGSRDKQLVAYVVPDPVKASVVTKLLELEKKFPEMEPKICELPNGMSIFYLVRHEVDTFYKEIFDRYCYLQQGITLSDGACVFDVGAHIGLFSLFVHRLYNDIKIFAFEPIPTTYEVMRLNLFLYGVNGNLSNCGISHKESREVFTYFPNSPAMSGCKEQLDKIVAEGLVTEQLPCITKSISQVIRENNVEQIDLLKIDVEKSEMNVLNGINHEDWSKIRQLVVEVHNVDGRLEQIIQLLEKHGYRVNCQQDTQYENFNLYDLYAIKKQGKQGTGPGSRKSTPALRQSNHRWYSPQRLEDELRRFSMQQLPLYMIPSAFVLLASLPMTPNGKVDRKALPEPGMMSCAERYEQPTDEVEKKLTWVWSEVLGIEMDKIGVTLNFFDLGGHSLKATQLVSRIHKEFNVTIPLAEVFKTPTVKGLAGYIRNTASHQYRSIKKIEEKEYYALSSAQKRLYTLHQIEKNSTSYNLPEVVILEGKVNKAKLKDTFINLINRHESLRTSFAMINEEPVQRIQKENDKFQITDYRQIPNHKLQITNKKKPDEEILYASDAILQIETRSHHSSFIIHHYFVRPFDLSQAPLLRVGLIEKDESTLILMMDMHHIISDAISHEILVQELMASYSGKELPVLNYHYKDYSEWYNKRLGSEEIKEQKNYWLKIFAGEIPPLDIPTDYPRPTIRTYEGSSISFNLDPGEIKAISTYVQEQGVTLFIFLLAIYYTLLAKISGQEDVIIGTVTSGRKHVDLEQIIGMFLNTLALRNYPEGNKTFKEFLKEVKETILTAFENQDYQFEDLVEEIGGLKDPARHALFDVVFTFLEINEKEFKKLEGLNIKSYEYKTSTSKFDLVLIGWGLNNELSFKFEFNTKLFHVETIEMFTRNFKEIISSVLENGNIKLKDIRISSDLLSAKSNIPQTGFVF